MLTQEKIDEFFNKSKIILDKKEIVEILLPLKVEELIKLNKKPLFFLDNLFFNNQFSILTQLIGKENFIKIKNPNNGMGLLHYCSRIENFSSLSLANALIEKGIDINQQDNEGLPPIHYALVAENKKMFEFFIEKNAFLNLTNKQEKSLLVRAASMKSNYFSLKLMKRPGFSISNKNQEDVEAVCHFVYNKNLEAIKIAGELGYNFKEENILKDDIGSYELALNLKRKEIVEIMDSYEQKAKLSFFSKEKFPTSYEKTKINSTKTRF